MKDKKKQLSELAAVLKKYPQVMVNIKVKEKKPFEKMPIVMKKIKEAEKILENKGRHLIRYSGTEDLARVMLEGPDESLLKKLAQGISDEIKKEVG
jgi:phosphoglucosamine mutase